MPVPERQNDDVLGELLAGWERASAATRAQHEAEIRRVFEEEHAIFVLDMSRFSSTVMRHGILHFLARIHAMRRLVVPTIGRFGGTVVKYIGDDVIALFPDVGVALAASESIVQATRLPEHDFKVAIGIGYGTLLHVPRLDIWGHEVNLAFKLGEDMAEADEILLSQGAHAMLDTAARERFRRVELSVSGLDLIAYSLT